VRRLLPLIGLLACASENDKGPDLVEEEIQFDDTGEHSDTGSDTGSDVSDDTGSGGDSGSDGGDSGEDSGEVTGPADEICDGLDNDLDGEIDEEDICDHPVLNHDGHAYLFIDTDMAWALARDACQELGYDLVKLESEAENAWVHEQVYPAEDDVGLLKAHTWIGLSDPSATWSWSWTDGDGLDFEFWSGEIVKDGYGTTHFGQAAAFGDHATPHWLVSPANWEYRSVCESDGGTP
jgi:hypothetical protein